MINNDIIFTMITTNNIERFLYYIAENIAQSKIKTLNNFFTLYSNNYSKNKNKNLLNLIITRLNKLTKDLNHKLLLELYLLLFFSSIDFHINDINKIKNTTEFKLCNFQSLLLDSNNLNKCKSICYNHIKSGEKCKFMNKFVDEKYKNENVWNIWHSLLIACKDNINLFSWVKHQFDIFSMFYKKTELKNRLNLIYNTIDVICEFKFRYFKLLNENVINKKYFEIMLKIDYIFIDIGYIQCFSRKDYFYNYSINGYLPEKIEEFDKKYSSKPCEKDAKKIVLSLNKSDKNYESIVKL